MRIIFMGTPAFAVPTLAALLDAGHQVVAVYTRAPKPAGRRGLDLTPSPVQRLADDRRLPVLTPMTLRNPEATATMAAHAAEVAVIVGYGMILPPAILAVPPLGCLNLHPSLLPRWRGAAPIQRPIMAGDAATAAAIMLMDEGLDTGPVGLVKTLPIPADATAGDMHDVLAAAGAGLMVEALHRLEAGELLFVPQVDIGAVYAAKIDKAEARIDWRAPAAVLHAKIRGLSPFPGAFFEVDLGRGLERIKVLRSRLAPGSGAAGTLLDDTLTVACGEGAVALTQVQRAGKGPMEAAAFLRGAPLKAGASILPA